MGIPIGSFFKSKYTSQQIENALAAFRNMAAEYDPTQTYNEGAVVLYNNALYIATGTTTGTFDPTKWTQTTLAGIGAEAGESAGREAAEDVLANTVQVVSQTFSDVQKEQARDNIDVLSSSEVYKLFPKKTVSNDPDNAVFDAVLNDAINAPVLSTVIKGKTVAQNQLVQNGNFSDGTTGWTALNSATLTASGKVATLNASTQNGLARSAAFDGVSGHLYFVSARIKTATETTLVQINMTGMGNWYIQPESSTNWQTVEGIKAAPSSGNKTVDIMDRRSSGWDAVQFTDVMCIDLTAAGYTAAETTDVATFKAAFLKRMGYPLPQFIPYDAGSLKNVNGTFNLCGRNLWDEEWELGSYSSGDGSPVTDSASIRSKSTNYIRVTGGETYYAKCPANISIKYYDANYNYVGSYLVSGGNGTFTVPTNAIFVRFNVGSAYGNTYNYDTCLNDNDPSLNGQYFPFYSGGTIDCSTAPLNGVGDAQDEKDYAKGTRTTRCGMVDLGTLNWLAASSGNIFYVTGAVSWIKFPPNLNTAFNGVCGKYQTLSYGEGTSTDKSIYTAWTGAGTNYLYIHDSAYSDAATLKTALSGTYLCYELATPVSSTETPQPLTTQYGYNVLRPVSGDVQGAEVAVKYTESIEGYINERLNA